MAISNIGQTKRILLFEGRSQRDYWRRFAALLALSVIIATMGLIRDSGAVVIAAMLIAPLMTPILGIAAAMMMGWTRRAARLFAIVVLAALASTGLAWLVMFVADIPKGIILPSEVVARTDPGIEELIVALAAGAAGAYVQVNKNEISLLPGAAIGVALVPPLSASGILVYFDEFRGAYEALLLFLTNLAAIILAACGVYIFTGTRKALLKSRKRFTRFTASFSLTLIVLIAIFIQLFSETLDRFTETRLEEEVADVLRDWSEGYSVEILRLDVNHKKRVVEIWLVVDAPLTKTSRLASVADLIPEELEERNLRRRLQAALSSDYDVGFRFQIRFAGRIDLKSGQTTDALPVEETLEDE